ncbi:MAG: guanylate kinase [bacterium]
MRKKRFHPLIIVISGPSGSGKSTVISNLLSAPPLNASAKFSVSATTRPPRPGETNARDYYFMSRKQFEKLKKQNCFAEWAKVHGEYYGTPRSEIERITKKRKDVVLELDVQGGNSIKKLYPDAVTIFLSVPQQTLRTRLLNRASSLPPPQLKKEIRSRLETAKKENKAAKNYKYVVKNIDLETATEQIHTIIETERNKMT